MLTKKIIALVMSLTCLGVCLAEYSPRIVSMQIPYPHGLPSSVSLKDGFAYVTNSWSRGYSVLIFDLRERSSIKYSGGIPATGYPSSVVLGNGTGYIPALFGITVFDLPKDAEKARLTMNMLLDFSVAASPSTHATLSENKLLVGGKSGLRIMDVSVPQSPVIKAFYPELKNVNMMTVSSKMLIWVRPENTKEIKLAKMKDNGTLLEIGVIGCDAPVVGLASSERTLLVLSANKKLQAYELGDAAPSAPKWVLQGVKSWKFKQPQAVLLMESGKIALLDAKDLSSAKITRELDAPANLNSFDCEGNTLAILEKTKLVLYDASGEKPQQVAEIPIIGTDGGLVADENMVYSFCASGGNSLLYGIAAKDSKRKAIFDVIYNFSAKASNTTAIARIDNYLFAAGSLIDVKEPAKPVFVKDLGMAPKAVRITASKTAYIAQGGSLTIADFSKLPEFSVLGTYKSEKPKAQILDVEIGDNELAFALNGPALEVLSVKDPAQVKVLGSVEGFNASKIFKAGNYVYIPSSNPAKDAGRLAIIDVSDPQTPRVAKELKGFVQAGCPDALVIGHNAYFIDGDEVKKLDLSEPLEPKLTAIYFGEDEGAGSYTSLTAGKGMLYGKKYNRIDAWKIQE